MEENFNIPTLVAYVVETNPHKVSQFLVKYSSPHSIQSKAELQTKCLEVLSDNAEDEDIIYEFIKLHPDKDLIIDAYKDNKLVCVTCGCEECSGHHKWYESPFFIYGVVLLVLLLALWLLLRNQE